MNKIKNKLLFILAKILTASAPGGTYLAFAGAGSAAQLCGHIRRSGFKRVLVVTDTVLRDLGIVDKALEGFKDSDVDIAFYDGVQPDPTFDQGAAGLAILKDHGSDAVLAIGGGSSIDCAKLIAATATSDEDPRDWIGFAKVKHEVMPLFAIPTTAGTGSEATMGAVISDSATHEKGVISGAGLGMGATALDPDLQMGMPPAITAATGMDALTHAIEAYICRWDRGTRKENAERAIRIIFANLERAYTQGDDAEARESMALASYYAGIAINQVNVGTVHAIAHQLGGKYQIPHGLANAMVLPHVLDYCAVEAEDSLAELAQLIGVATAGQSAREQARAFIDAVVSLRDAVGIPATSEKINSADFDYLTGLAVAEATGYFAPRLLDEAGCKEILAKISA
ncbi:iron-containing alcohol dehydrogenase [Congregibacter litoralis]|uniref:Alcohol dehydrogenase, class IV n=1 Tax=Congregibacter litoralis KT71 TaxID=314285 RepID=A4AC61_9GAMM|nr:iron-containing alcohol dehydrogenase [Congregibacter litoralis]EAQ96511.1 Alcohol dehydrogenase, class IV [Congregibacter litoralis KT71]